MLAYISRRLIFALFLVFAVSSASLVLARLAGGDYVTESLGIEAHRETVDQARARSAWTSRSARSTATGWDAPSAWTWDARCSTTGRSAISFPSARRTRRSSRSPRCSSPRSSACRSASSPAAAAAGPAASIPSAIRGASLVLLSMPPLLTSLFLIFVAARTGWMPIAGMRSPGEPATGLTLDLLHHLIVPAGALALPLAAMFERLQAQAMAEAIGAPFVLATLARGVPRSRVVWRDALKVSLRPVAAVYGLVVGTLAERIVRGGSDHGVARARPPDARRAAGPRHLPGRRLRRRRLHFSRAGTLLSDAALALVDPRAAES